MLRQRWPLSETQKTLLVMATQRLNAEMDRILQMVAKDALGDDWQPSMKLQVQDDAIVEVSDGER